MSKRILFSIILTTILLVACSSDTPEEGQTAVESAKKGVAISAVLAGENLLTQPLIRPTSVLGVYVTSFLSTNAGAEAHSAIDGIQAQLELYFGQEADSDASAAVIEQLGTTLQVDVKELLNRSPNRSESLEEYLDFLSQASLEARAVYDDLGSQLKETDSQLSAKRKEASTLKRDISKAISSKDFALAGAKQELFNAAQSDVLQLQGERTRLSDTMALIKKLLLIAEQRLTAITQNRDALIAGVTVVDIPGVSDLGVLKKGTKAPKNASSSPFTDL